MTEVAVVPDVAAAAARAVPRGDGGSGGGAREGFRGADRRLQRAAALRASSQAAHSLAAAADFFTDERAVPPDDPLSNYRLAREGLLQHVKPAAVHRLHGEAPDSGGRGAARRRRSPLQPRRAAALRFGAPGPGARRSPLLALRRRAGQRRPRRRRAGASGGGAGTRRPEGAAAHLDAVLAGHCPHGGAAGRRRREGRRPLPRLEGRAGPRRLYRAVAAQRFRQGGGGRRPGGGIGVCSGCARHRPSAS